MRIRFEICVSDDDEEFVCSCEMETNERILGDLSKNKTDLYVSLLEYISWFSLINPCSGLCDYDEAMKISSTVEGHKQQHLRVSMERVTSMRTYSVRIKRKTRT